MANLDSMVDRRFYFELQWRAILSDRRDWRRGPVGQTSKKEKRDETKLRLKQFEDYHSLSSFFARSMVMNNQVRSLNGYLERTERLSTPEGACCTHMPCFHVSLFWGRNKTIA